MILLWGDLSYRKFGVKSYFYDGDLMPNGAFWFDAEYQNDGTIIKLIDYEGEYKNCFTLKDFEGNNLIQETMKKNNQHKLCVSI